MLRTDHLRMFQGTNDLQSSNTVHDGYIATDNSTEGVIMCRHAALDNDVFSRSKVAANTTQTISNASHHSRQVLKRVGSACLDYSFAADE